MKKIIYILLILVLSAGIILATLSGISSNKNRVSDYGIGQIFGDSGKTSTYNDKEKLFVNFDDEEKLPGNFYYKSLNPIDGVYYKINSGDGLKVSKDEDKTVFNISKGEYVFVLNSDFENYQIIDSNFEVTPLSSGIFYIIANSNKTYFYPINSSLNISLGQDDNMATSINLMPSLLFGYSPSTAKDIKDADILRVSVVQTPSIMYFDSIKDLEKQTYNGSQENIINYALNDINKRITFFNELYKQTLNLSVVESENSELALEFEKLFVNKEKRDFIFKNKIFISLVNIFKKYNNEELEIDLGEEKRTIVKLIEDNKGTPLEKDLQEIIKAYYYLSFYNSYKMDIPLRGKSLNNPRNDIYNIIKNSSRKNNLYIMFSYAFFKKQFYDKNDNSIDVNIDNILYNLTETNLLEKQDFSTLSMFLNNYLDLTKRVSSNSINIVMHLINVFNNYFLSLEGTDDQALLKKQFNSLSNFYYIIGNAAKNLNESILRIYFEKNKDGKYILKEGYFIDNGIQKFSNIGDDFRESIVVFNKSGLEYIMTNKHLYEKYFIDNHYNFNESENHFSSMREKFSLLDSTVEMITNYNSYYSKLSLNEDSYSATALVYSDKHEFSKKNIQDILSQFRGINIGTIQIKNSRTMDKDTYYDLEVELNGEKISFKYFPNGNVITGLKKSSNLVDEGFVLNLDEVEENYKELGEDDPTISYANLFVNIFTNKTISNDNTSNIDLITGQDGIVERETKDIILFKQNDLIKGDFTYLKNSIIIPYKNISVKIVNGKYDIDINNIQSNISYSKADYMIEINSKYDFVDHSFYDFRINVFDKKGDRQFLNGNSVYIYPQKIRIQDFEKLYKNLPYLLENLVFSYTSGKDIKIDLKLERVYIDGKSFDFPKYSN